MRDSLAGRHSLPGFRLTLNPGYSLHHWLFTIKQYSGSEIVLDFTCSVVMLCLSRSTLRGAPSGGAEGASPDDRGGLQMIARNPCGTGTSSIFLSVDGC